MWEKLYPNLAYFISFIDKKIIRDTTFCLFRKNQLIYTFS